jgi:hypothetical protein
MTNDTVNLKRTATWVHDNFALMTKPGRHDTSNHGSTGPAPGLQWRV